MMASIIVLSRWLHLSIRVLHSIAQMRKAFHVLYLFDFDTALARRKLLWYKNHIAKVLSFSNYFISYIKKHRSVMMLMKHYNAWQRQFEWTFQLEEQQRDSIQLKLCIRDIL